MSGGSGECGGCGHAGTLWAHLPRALGLAGAAAWLALQHPQPPACAQVDHLPSSGVGGQVLLTHGGHVLRRDGEAGCDCDCSSGSCNFIDGLSSMSRNMASCCASTTSPCTKRHRAPYGHRPPRENDRQTLVLYEEGWSCGSNGQESEAELVRVVFGEQCLPGAKLIDAVSKLALVAVRATAGPRVRRAELRLTRAAPGVRGSANVVARRGGARAGGRASARLVALRVLDERCRGAAAAGAAHRRLRCARNKGERAVASVDGSPHLR